MNIIKEIELKHPPEYYWNFIKNASVYIIIIFLVFTGGYWPEKPESAYNEKNCTELFNPAKGSDFVKYYCAPIEAQYSVSNRIGQAYFLRYMLVSFAYLFFVVFFPMSLDMRQLLLSLLIPALFFQVVFMLSNISDFKKHILDYNYIICKEGIKWTSGFLPFEKVSYILITKKYFYPVIDFRAADDKFGQGESLFAIKMDWYYRQEYISQLKQASGKPIRFRDRSIVGLKEWEREELVPYRVKRE